MELLRHYFSSLDETRLAQLESLAELYQTWNQKINVISRKDMDAFEQHHLLHSLGIAKLFDFDAGSHILDVGTGGGFPGIPLAIYYPEVEFTLIDSIGKKVKVVREVADALGLKNVSAAHQRAEETQGKFDYVVSRAVTRADRFVPWVEQKVKWNQEASGMIFLKGGELKKEFSVLKRPYTIYRLSDYYEEDFFETKKLVHLKK